jgi:hypothetical protein
MCNNALMVCDSRANNRYLKQDSFMVDSLLSVLAVFITMSITRSLGANVKSWLDTIKLALSELTFFDTEGDKCNFIYYLG